ncbi:MAG: GNAT family N-acetyltransferase [Candidatus Omnitrophica bacterium]|nr:GNAT family N-acetyltransferase [Candidatus Omnitrophota bacterium]
MFECKVYPQLSPSDRESVLDFLSRSFGMNYSDGRALFDFVLNYRPGLQFIIAKEQGKEIVGVLGLVDREFNYFGVPLKLAGLSMIAVHPKIRDFSVATALKERMFDYIDKNAALCIGISRKKVDGYWYPYGFTGFTNFGQLTVDTAVFPRDESDTHINLLESHHIPRVQELFELTYQNVLGALNRSETLWNYYLKNAQRMNLSSYVFENDDDVVGYVFKKDNVIYEFGFKDAYAMELLSLFHSTHPGPLASSGDVHFELGLCHPLCFYLREMPHKISTRHVWNGGHIVRITSLIDFLGLIGPVLELRLKRSLVKDFELEVGDVHFSFAREKLKVLLRPGEQQKEAGFLSVHDWQKMIFGVVSAEQILALKDFLNKEILNIMFPVVSPQIPLIDEL